MQDVTLPLIYTCPHLGCDVGLEEREYFKKTTHPKQMVINIGDGDEEGKRSRGE